LLVVTRCTNAGIQTAIATAPAAMSQHYP
jgi:hypothetical protein